MFRNHGLLNAVMRSSRLEDLHHSSFQAFPLSCLFRYRCHDLLWEAFTKALVGTAPTALLMFLLS